MTSLFLQADGGGLMGLLPFVLILGVMYLFIFRPQAKKQKEEKAFRETVAKGNRIVTTSGIHGKILEVGETHLIIESENSRLKIEKAAVSKEMTAQYDPKAKTEEKKK
ncbi:MAG: preprotein translocase subunit YajC [Schleiferiaceae bacterium]